MTHFITGGTGFLGSSIILDLLMYSDHKIYCMARPKHKKSGLVRLFDRLAELIHEYDYDPSLLKKAYEQITVIEGALGDNIEGIKYQIETPIDQFIHSAASLNYEERFREEIFSTNVGGTKWALSLSEKLKCKTFNYVSTAYVVGNSSGLIKEEYVDEDKSNNVYESSKLAAEKIVVNSGLNHRIFRPGIIIGHSKTFYTFNFTGLYGFLRKLAQFKGVMGRIQKGYLDQNPIKMLAESEVTINLVQVDMVSKHLVKAILNESKSKFYHLTNPVAPTMEILSKYVFELSGLQKSILELDQTEFNWIDKKFNEKIDFYKPQFFGNKTFDRTNINEAIGENEFDEFAVSTDRLISFINWYIDYLQKRRKTTPVTR